MIAAARQRIGASLTPISRSAARWSHRVDRTANRALERAHPPLLRGRDRAVAGANAAAAWAGPRLRPVGAFLFRALARLDRGLRRAWAATVTAATAASAAVTPRRALGAVAIAAGCCLIASQTIDYRGVEVGQGGYAGLPGGAAAPTVDPRTAGEAHAYLLVPLGALAALLGLACVRREQRRIGLPVLAIGLLSLAVILLVDLPAGLDEGAQSARFAGATAVLQDGFYGELAAAFGLVLTGLLYYARPCRIPISSSGRAASARRRRPRRRASSRARVARSA
jgi:hypothetical protein